MKPKDFGLKELLLKYPKEYKLLLEAYRNDSCLVFFIVINNNLCAESDFGEEYCFIDNRWERIK